MTHGQLSQVIDAMCLVHQAVLRILGIVVGVQTAAQMIEAATKFGKAATFSQKLMSFQSPCRSLQTLQSGAWTATGGAAGGGLRMR